MYIHTWHICIILQTTVPAIYLNSILDLVYRFLKTGETTFYANALKTRARSRLVNNNNNM